jgi:pimeloyl-ACP methyl ester carboxylesterase
MGPRKKPLVVFVHGVDGSAAEAAIGFGAVLDPARFRLFTYDLLGRGEDLGADRKDHSIDAYVAQLRRVTSKLPAAATAPFFLVGFSMGAAIAAVFAMRYPERVRKLCLICPAGRSVPASYLALGSYMLPFQLWKATVVPMAIERVRQSFEGTTRGSTRSSSSSQAIRRRIDQVLRRKTELYQDDRFLRVAHETVKQFPFSAVPLSPVRVPALVIAAKSDRAVPTENARRFAADIGARVKVVSGTHAVIYTRPDAVREAVEAFFAL